jgi:hypothetical protein
MTMQGIGPVANPHWPAPSASPAQPIGVAAEPETRPQDPAATARPEWGAGAAAGMDALQPDGPRAPDAAPEGVDGELWSLLTTEERAHFSRFAAMGGVTYGPRSTPSSRPLVSGQRLDLRV